MLLPVSVLTYAAVDAEETLFVCLVLSCFSYVCERRKDAQRRTDTEMDRQALRHGRRRGRILKTGDRGGMPTSSSKRCDLSRI